MRWLGRRRRPLFHHPAQTPDTVLTKGALLVVAGESESAERFARLR